MGEATVRALGGSTPISGTRDVVAGARRSSAPTGPIGGTHAALQLFPVASFVVDESGSLIASNEPFERLTGVPGAILTGRGWWQAFASATMTHACEAQSQMVRANKSYGTTPLEAQKSDGSATTLSLCWQRVTEPETRRPLWIVSIIESERAQPQPTAPEPTAQELAALVQAELKTIVALEDPVRKLARLERLQRALGRSHAARSASMQVSDVLMRALGPRMVELRNVLVTQIDARGSVSAKTADPARILSLAIDDALERSPESASLRLRVWEEADLVRLELSDRGRAISAERQARIAAGLFDDQSESSDGLVLAASLARALGGALALRSVGRGCVLCVTLPAA
ncbi:MAG: PAS domain S-box protein [Deltaproteobacteria bacterium]|nr:PAS domain S-box protein [Deltaproteobacteria bacterium]